MQTGDDMKKSHGDAVSAEKRLVIVDIIRGFSLLGVVIINVFSFNMPPDSHVSQYELSGSMDSVLFFLVKLAIEGKFYTLFSTIFGLSFALQVERLQGKGTPIKAVFLRRFFWLFVIGFIHAVMIWSGDILQAYAIWGLILLFFHASNPRKIRKWALALLVLFYMGIATGVVMTVASQAEQVAEPDQESVEQVDEPIADQQFYRDGTYMEVTWRRLESAISPDKSGLMLAGLLMILPFFLFGAYIGKNRLLHELESNRRTLKKMWLWGAATSLVFCTLYIILWLNTTDGEPTVGRGVMKLAEYYTYPSMALLIFSSLPLLYMCSGWKKLLDTLAPVGRMALTNYLLQSVVLTFLFYGYGIGYMGQTSLILLLLISGGFFVFQILYSAWWLRHFRFGPIEWLWRCLTYNKILPIRR